MRRHHRSTAVAVALAALLAWGIASCGKSSSVTSARSTATTATTTSTVAGTAFDATSHSLGASDSLAPLPCGPLGFPVGIPSGCPWDAATSSFVCAQDARRDGLVETHGYQFLDAPNAAQSAYDSLTTASIQFTSHLSGTTTSGPKSTVDDTHTLVVSGLAGNETTRIWNGNGSSSRQDSVRTASGMVLVQTASTTTVADVIVPRPWARDSWPVSGTITTHVVSSDGTTTLDITAVLTFNGTRYATMTAGGKTYTIDLQQPPHGPNCPGGPGGPGGAPGDSTGGGAPHDSTGGGAPRDSTHHGPGGGPGGPGGRGGPGGPGGPGGHH